MYAEDIDIDGTRTTIDQQWRIFRIHRVLGYAQALADANNNEEYHRKIAAIFDDKGTLRVEWLSEPTKTEKMFIKNAWESIVSSYETNPLIHEVIKKDIKLT